MTEYLDLADYLVIAEAVLDINAEVLARSERIGLADSALHAPRAEFGGTEFYPDLQTKAAVLCSRLIRNHPLPDGNKRAAYLALLEFLSRNSIDPSPLSYDADQTVAMIEGVAAGTISEEMLGAWIAQTLER